MLELVHFNTVAIEPINEKNCLDQTETMYGLSGKGTIKIKNADNNDINIGDTAFYNACAGAYVQQLDLVVCNIDDILILDKKDSKQ